MAFLRLQKRLAATVLKCGKRRVWIDPNEIYEVDLANSRNNIRKLFNGGLIMKRAIQSTPYLDAKSSMWPREREDILDTEKEREPRTPECHPRYSG
mgnify:CR=1 FL=1